MFKIDLQYHIYISLTIEYTNLKTYHINTLSLITKIALYIKPKYQRTPLC